MSGEYKLDRKKLEEVIEVGRVIVDVFEYYEQVCFGDKRTRHLPSETMFSKAIEKLKCRGLETEAENLLEMYECCLRNK